MALDFLRNMKKRLTIGTIEEDLLNPLALVCISDVSVIFH